jgi:hypothetical protein
MFRVACVEAIAARFVLSRTAEGIINNEVCSGFGAGIDEMPDIDGREP